MKTKIFGVEWNIDPVLGIIVLMFLLLGFNYYTKYLADDVETSDRGKEVLGYSKIKEICVDQQGVTTCVQLENVVYKLMIETNPDNGMTNLIITKK